MRNRDRINLLATGARHSLSALLLVVCAAAGLYVAGTAWGDGSGANEYVCNYPPAPDDVQQSMTPNGQPFRSGSNSQILPLILKTDNSERRLVSDDLAFFGMNRQTADANNLRPTCSSTAAVDARLGRRFTLVGAKPSGTG